MSDATFVCEECRGLGEYASGRSCAPCRGGGSKLCDCCREVPATQVVDGTHLCETCSIIESGCAYCVSGAPTSFHDGKPCCEECLDTFAEAWRSSDTVPCAAPDFEEVA